MCGPHRDIFKTLEDDNRTTASLISILENSFDYYGDGEMSLEDEAQRVYTGLAAREHLQDGQQ